MAEPVLSPVANEVALPEHSSKPVASQAAVVSSRQWAHAFGEMLIETCVDGSVWIDGKPVPETLPDRPLVKPDSAF